MSESFRVSGNLFFVKDSLINLLVQENKMYSLLQF